VYKKMLVPLDCSKLAEIVLPYVSRLAMRMNLEIVLLHVCEAYRLEENYICSAYLEHVAEILKTRLIASLGGKDNPTHRAITIGKEVITGNPAEEILDYSESNNVDFILLASQGFSGVRRWALGSTADKVMAKSNIPVWLIKAGADKQVTYDKNENGSIHVLLDGSKTAEAVLPHVKLLARQLDSDNIVLLRVFEEPFVTADYPEASMKSTWQEHVKQIRKYFRDEAMNYLNGVHDMLADAGPQVKKVVLMGEPAMKILEYTGRHRPDVVVMSTHGFSAVNRWEYGNIANKLLHSISCPIFLVRPPKSELI
jgi:nucleotide-binding universal stress UspA family protein